MSASKLIVSYGSLGATVHEFNLPFKTFIVDGSLIKEEENLVVPCQSESPLDFDCHQRSSDDIDSETRDRFVVYHVISNATLKSAS